MLPTDTRRRGLPVSLAIVLALALAAAASSPCSSSHHEYREC
jgi:regulator of sirC expression with transglutaminase-like and TPR domain